MKILMINQGAFPFQGSNGCSVQIFSIISSFLENKHEIYLINFNTIFDNFDKELAINQLKGKGVKIIFIDNIIEEKRKKSIIKKIKYYLKPNINQFYNGVFHIEKIDNLINEIKPDFIYGYTMNAIMSYDYEKHLIPFSFSNIDIDSMVYLYRHKYREKTTFVKYIKSILKVYQTKKLDNLLFEKIKFSKCCFEHAYHHMLWLKNKGLENVFYFPVNVVENNFEIKKKNKDNVLKIGMLGNVNGIATLAGLVDFFDNYLNNIEKQFFFANIEINIIGGGNLREKIAKKIINYNNIKRHGYFKELKDIYYLNDIILVPTPINLGFRTRIVEAFSFGSCVITHKANSDAMPEFINNFNGFVYTNPYELNEIINKLINDKDLMKTIGINARQTYLSKLSGELVGQKMVEKLSLNLK